MSCYNKLGDSMNTFVTIVCAFIGIVGILATIFSAIGLSKVLKTGQKGKVFAIIGLISGIINVIYAFIVIMIFF